MKSEPATLVRRLLAWYRENRRDLPWRGAPDAYRVWVSEVMLQQTRVETVRPYYERFVQLFPDVAALAAAPWDDLFRLWAGLGYYRRARLLQDAARQIRDRNGGRFPENYDAIRALPGIGEYTAAAIASIAFDQPRAALDGNAYRVLARLADDRREIAKSAVKQSLGTTAQRLMDAVHTGERGDFTQALMELGATVCVPRAPRCEACPWVAACAGFAAGSAPDLPTKAPRRTSLRISLAVVIARCGDDLLLRQRPPEAAVMPGFWELPTVPSETFDKTHLASLRLEGVERIGTFGHAITTTNYTCQVYVAEAFGSPGNGYGWVARSQLGSLPLATIASKALRLALGEDSRTADPKRVPRL